VSRADWEGSKKQTGQQISEIIADRKFREKLARIEARVGGGPPPLLALAVAQGSLHIGETGWPTQGQIDAEIAKSRERRNKRLAGHNSLE
jgi:hypothetical protein